MWSINSKNSGGKHISLVRLKTKFLHSYLEPRRRAYFIGNIEKETAASISKPEAGSIFHRQSWKRNCSVNMETLHGKQISLPYLKINMEYQYIDEVYLQILVKCFKSLRNCVLCSHLKYRNIISFRVMFKSGICTQFTANKMLHLWCMLFC